MIKGHMNQSRKNQRSTKPKSMAPTPEHGDGIAYDPADMFPLSDSNNARTHQCYADVVEPNPVTGQIHSKQTDRFVVVSNSGNNYILVVYDYDCNGILIEPMKNRTADSILKAFTAIHARLVATGLRPQLHRLDSECSEASKSFLGKETINFQLVPPSVHRRNAADRAIRTFKNHFVAGLYSVDKHFPLHLWDKLVLPQAESTLNMMRGSRINPKVSANRNSTATLIATVHRSPRPEIESWSI